MELTLTQIINDLCAECHNYFASPNGGTVGNYEIADGSIDLAGLVSDGQYFRITGSVFNDGVYQYPCVFEHDEAFHGAVWPMAIKPEFIQAAADILTWRNKYDDAAGSPYTSESFGGYTYSKSEAVASGGWRGAFNGVIKRWRKI